MAISFTLGKYHSLVCPSNDPYTIVPDTNFLLDDYPIGASGEPAGYATDCGESQSQSFAEVVSCLVNMTNITTGGTVEIIWYDLDESTVLYRTDYSIPSPQSHGYDYWSWYSVASWIGHFPHEIKGPGRYKVQINTFLGSRTLYYTVYSNKGSISCKSTPHGASILLGKVIPNQQTIYVNQNKITLAFIPVILTNIDPGRYSVMFIKDEYDRCLSEVTVVKESEVLASCTLLKTVTTGKLECISSPSGAQVYLDDKTTSSGTCPLVLSDLQPGTHTILFKLSGYEDCQKQIEVYVGQTRTVACELVKPTGFIDCQAKDSITNVPLNATLQIDGITIVPKTPHTTPAIAIGSHDITFILDGYATMTVPVTVFSGQTAHVFGVMVPIEVPGPGFDITINIPSIPVLQPLHVVRVIKFPFTNTWVPLVIAPIIGTQIRWNNISNQLYKARQNEFDCRPAPALYSGTPIKEGEHYAIHAGKQISPIYTDEIVHTVTSGKVSITVSKLAEIPPWLITLCGYFDVSPGNCITSFYNVIPDIVYSAEDISIIKDGKSIYPPYDAKTPTAWNYLFAAMPVVPIGKIAKVSKPLSKLVKDIKLTLSDTLDTNTFLTKLKDLNLLHHITEMPTSQIDEISDFITKEEWVLIKAELAKNGRYITAYEFMRYATEVDPNLFKKGYVNALIHSTWGEYTDISKITEKIELLDSSGATKRRQWWHEFVESLESVVGKTRSEEIVKNLGLDKIIERAKRNEKIFLLGLDEYRDIVKKLEDLGVPKSTVDDMMSVTDAASAKPFFKRFLAETLAYPTKHPGKTALWIIGTIAGVIGTSEFILWKFKEMLLDPPNFNLVKAVQLGDHETALEHLAHFKYMIEGSEPSFRLISYASPFSITMIPLYLDNMKKTHDMYADILGVPEQKFHPNEFLFPEIITGEVLEIKDGDTVRCNFKLLGVPEKGATSPENSTVYKHNGEVLEKGGTFIPGDLETDVRFLGINTPESHLYDYSCTNVREPYLVRRLEALGNECISEETWHVDSDFYNSTKIWIGNTLPLHQMATFKSDTNRQFDNHGRLLAVPFVNGTNICLKSLAKGQSVVFFYDENKQVITSQFLASEVFPRSAQSGIWAFGAGTGTIKCISYPTGAEVWLDEEYTDKKTSSNVAYLTNIVAGYHLITFKKIINNVPRECSIDITVIKDQTIDAECTLPTSSTNTGSIKCISYPTSAEVWLDGNYTGKKTSSNVAYLFDIAAGPHTITLKKIINNVPTECSDNVTVIQDQTVTAECTLPTGVTPIPTPIPTPTPTPSPKEIGTWNVEDAKNAAGAILSAAKVHINNVYLHHYAPEKVIFCDGCNCDNLTPCGFGTHTLTIKRSGYMDWSATRTIAPGTNIFEFPVMMPIGVTPTPTPVPTPTPPPIISGQIHCKTTGPTGAPIIGAKIYITGNNLSDVYMGNTDSIITVGVGAYIVKYIYLGYEDCIKGVNVSENQTVDGTCQMKPVTTHTISIESVPPGATITIL